ncbi:positive regulation of potassium ion import [Halocaridina rubra]|uniref:Positive regulation of potassium ion import n=1 Tax=Halocaridina rubra TaxID=373956 RepID=A0AAN9AFV4_HALRR
MSKDHTSFSNAGEYSVSSRNVKQAESEALKSEIPSGRRYDPRPSWKLFIWNPQKKEFLCRTASSWCKIIMFYIVFYLFLAGFFTVMMIVFYSTLSDYRPTYTSKGGESIMSSPGLSVRPIFYRYISYHPDINHIYASYYVGSVDEFVEKYNNTRNANMGLYRNCEDENAEIKAQDICDFDISNLAIPEGWGYNTRSPSFIVKLNKVFDWEPELIDGGSEKLPEDLRQYIRNSNGTLSKLVWLWCKDENNTVQFTYSPRPGFPAYYYPFLDQKGYLSPLVVVSVSSPLPYDQDVKVICTAYAGNIKTPSLHIYFYILSDSSA